MAINQLTGEEVGKVLVAGAVDALCLEVRDGLQSAPAQSECEPGFVKSKRAN